MNQLIKQEDSDKKENMEGYFEVDDCMSKIVLTKWNFELTTYLEAFWIWGLCFSFFPQTQGLVY